MTDQEAEKFCQTFADGLKSGLSFVRILNLIDKQGLSTKTVERLKEALDVKGDQLGEAFIRYGILDSNARNLLIVAEQEGALPETFKHLAVTYRQRYKRKKRFLIATFEPYLLISLGLIAFLNILEAGLIDLAFGGDTTAQLIDLAIKSLIEIGLFGLACLLVGMTWLKLPVDMSLRDLGARLWMRLPVLSEPTRDFAIATFCRYLYKGIDSGMAVNESLELAANAANHPKILKHYERAIQHIEEGHTLTEALSAIPALSDDLLDHIELGEESGRLEERLTDLARRYQERAEATFDRHLRVFILLLRYSIIIFVMIATFVSVLGQNDALEGVLGGGGL
ncbi:MAG: type II secretion system F family protein [Persicimonas sp.]